MFTNSLFINTDLPSKLPNCTYYKDLNKKVKLTFKL